MMKTWLMSLVYSVLLLLFLLVDAIKWIASLNASALRLRKPEQLKRDWQWGQKFGLLPLIKSSASADEKTLLIHCASVGEVVASIELLSELVKKNPDLFIVVTTNTLTGKQQLERSVKGTELEERVVHNYLPIDLNGLMRRFVKYIQPDLVMIMEVEMWPNFIKQVKQFGAPLVVVNGRMTDKTCAGYQKFASLSKPMLASLDYIFARNSGDYDNYLKLAIPPEKLDLVGNIKFDIALPSGTEAQNLRSELGLLQRTVIVAGSTHAGEEQSLIDCFKSIQAQQQREGSQKSASNKLLLLIAPRHPHRFDEVYDLLQKNDVHVSRMSLQSSADESTEVLLGDKMGELSRWYGMADIVFIGGSLVKRGGHNPIEAAAYAKPIIMGPHIYNNPEIIQSLADDGGLTMVDDESNLLSELELLIASPSLAATRGKHALETLKTNQGVIDKITSKVSTHYLSSN